MKHHPLGSHYNTAAKPRCSAGWKDVSVTLLAFLSPLLFWGLLGAYVNLNPCVSIQMCFPCFSKQCCLTMFPTPTWANAFWEGKAGKSIAVTMQTVSCLRHAQKMTFPVWLPLASLLIWSTKLVDAGVPNLDWKRKRGFKKPPFWITKPVLLFKLNFYQQVLAFCIMLVIYWLFASHAGMKSAQSTLPWRKLWQGTSPQADLQSLFLF